MTELTVRRGWFVVWAVVLGIAAGVFAFTGTEFVLNPFAPIMLENTSAVAFGPGNDLWVVHDSNRAVSRISEEGKLLATISGGSRDEEAFFIAREIAVDGNGNLLVLHDRWDASGSWIENEVVTGFDGQGRYIDTIFELPDPTEGKILPSVRGLSATAGEISWFVLGPDDIAQYGVDGSGAESVRSLGSIPYAQADILVQDVVRSADGRWIVASKQGRITSEPDGVTVWDARAGDPSGRAVVHDLRRDPVTGQLLFLDVGRGVVVEIPTAGSPDETERIIGLPDEENRGETYYAFDVTGDTIVVLNDSRIVILGADAREIGPLRPTPLRLLGRIAAILAVVAGILSTVMLVTAVVRAGHHRRVTAGAARTILVVSMIVIAAGITGALAIGFYSGVLKEQTYNSLKNIVESANYIVDGDVVATIDHPWDFGGESYTVVEEQLQQLIHYNGDPWNANLYTALYTVADGRYWALMYNDNSVTPWYPFNAWTDDPYFYYFRDAWDGEVTEGTETDADGSYLFAMAPVRDSSGEVVAIVEAGMNMYVFEEWTARIVRAIAVDIASVIIIMILLLSELSFALGWNRQRRTGPVNELNVIRPLAGITYVLVFMCMAFIPLMARSIYAPLWGLPEGVAIGLPIFAEVFFAALTIIVAGFVMEKRGWRLIFWVGTIILIVTAVATGLTRSLLVFIIVRAVAGIGNGLIQMTMYGFINTGRTLSDRNEAFAQMVSGAVAGVNLGVVFGANLADKIGYFNVFFVMAGIGLLALLFERLVMRAYPSLPGEVEPDEEDQSSGRSEALRRPGALKYFTAPNVATFFVTILVPAFLCYMFLEYYFPLFAERNGMSTSVIGIVFSLYGLFIVWFGPTISTAAEQRLGVRHSSTLASIITGLALMVFAVTGSLPGAIAAILLLALSDSFGETVYTSYFLALRESRAIGKSVAAGYLEFVSQVGKMAGALAFGIAISLGDQPGIGVIGLGTIALAFLFATLSKERA